MRTTKPSASARLYLRPVEPAENFFARNLNFGPLCANSWPRACCEQHSRRPLLSAKLHYTDTGYGPPTDELTTILQLVVQQIHHQRTKICHVPTSERAEMLGSGIAMWQICCNYIIVVSLSVGGVCCWWCTACTRSRCPCSGVWALSQDKPLYSTAWFFTLYPCD